MQLSGFEKSTIMKTCFLHINHHVGSINEGKYFWIIDWFLMVDFVYLIPPIVEEKDFWIIDWFLMVDLVVLIPPNRGYQI
jgi:hypothetical protein